jgi:hypothetical protein
VKFIKFFEHIKTGRFYQISIENNIIQMNAANASNTISESDYGIHTLVVYEDLTILREFYSQYVKKGIEERNEVIQLAPFYEDSVRKILSEGHMSIDIEKWEKAEKSLIIVDSLKKYIGNVSPDSDYNYNKTLVEYAKSKGKAGVSIIADKGTFPFKHRIDDLVNFELSLPSKYDIELKRICVYHQKDLNRLSEEQKQKLLSHHVTAIKI